MINNREYNIRLILNKKGEMSIGFCHSLYATKYKTIQEWKEVPVSIKRSICKRLGAEPC